MGAAVGVAGDAGGRGVLHPVVPSAQRVQGAGAGGPVGVADDVVEVAVDGAAPAGRHGAGAVPEPDQPVDDPAGSVGSAAAGGHGAGCRGGPAVSSAAVKGGAERVFVRILPKASDYRPLLAQLSAAGDFVFGGEITVYAGGASKVYLFGWARAGGLRSIKENPGVAGVFEEAR